MCIDQFGVIFYEEKVHKIFKKTPRTLGLNLQCHRLDMRAGIKATFLIICTRFLNFLNSMHCFVF